MVMSRAKGARVERQIANLLREWLGDDWKVARLRTDEQKGGVHAGEFAITAPHMRFPFAIECKAHAAFTAAHLWREPVPVFLVDWWTQAVQQAEGAGLLPMLLIWRARRDTLCVLRRPTASALRLTISEPSMRLWLDDGTPGGDSLWVGKFRAVRLLDPSKLTEVW